MRKTTLALAIAAALTAVSGNADAQDSPFVCPGLAQTHPVDGARIDALSHNVAMRNIVFQYMIRWDAQYMRAACESAARGEPTDMSCLNGRRDWAAIEAMIPGEYFGMSSSALRPYSLELREDRAPTLEAGDYCRDLGVIPQGFSFH